MKLGIGGKLRSFFAGATVYHELKSIILIIIGALIVGYPTINNIYTEYRMNF